MKSVNSTPMEEGVLSVIQYFDFFDYPVSLDQIHKYVTIRATQEGIKKTLGKMVSTGTIEVFEGKYAVRGHSILAKNSEKKAKLTRKKVESASRVIGVLNRFKTIQLIGLSGSCAMDNAREDDDIDLFIITRRNRLWTARALCLITAALYGRRRTFNETQPKNKICFNLLFDETDMTVPYFKRNIYTAHEVAQMRPLHVQVRAGVYEKFMKANNWVGDYFPNLKLHGFKDMGGKKDEEASRKGSSVGEVVGNIFEWLLRTIQIFIIARHQTTEYLTLKQLWFFPDDFEKKIQGHKSSHSDSMV